MKEVAVLKRDMTLESFVFPERGVSQFLMAPVTNYHVLSGLNNTNFLSYSSVVQKSNSGHTGLKIKVFAVLHSFLENLLPRSFQLLGFLQLWAHSLLLPSPKPAVKDQFLLMSHLSKPSVIAKL